MCCTASRKNRTKNETRRSKRTSDVLIVCSLVIIPPFTYVSYRKERKQAIINPEWRKRIYNKPDLTATDYSPETLAAAAHNWRLLNPEWHDAASCNATDGEICYYRDPESGSHGWMCTECYGIVQTGQNNLVGACPADPRGS
jgi:hypothetical protein